LIEWQVERLARAGFDRLVVNHSYLDAHRGAPVTARFGVRIRYSPEQPHRDRGWSRARCRCSRTRHSS
jgi:MurNAc alpha-1-phosphate uridylyltransferase